MSKIAGLLITAASLAASTVSADILIDSDFSTGTVSSDSRVRRTQANGNWFKNASSNWAITGGSLSNPSTATGVGSEGILSHLVATDSLSGTLTNLEISFDYTVGATSTLRFAMVGYTANLRDGQSDSNILMNNGTSNGSHQNNTQAELRYGDINLLTGADMGQSFSSDGITFAATTSGTYSNTINLTNYAWHADEAADATPNNNDPGLSGGITSIADFDFVAIIFMNDLSTATGASPTILDNVRLEATSVPETGSLAFLCLGVVAFASRRRMKHANLLRFGINSIEGLNE